MVFIETTASAEEPAYTIAASYAGFVRGHMEGQCERFGCSALAEHDYSADGEGK